MLDMILYRLGLVRRSNHLHLCDAYAEAVDRYLDLEDYLVELRDITPHEHIKQEINDVLRQTRGMED